MLRFRIRTRPRKFSSTMGHGTGPEGRIERMRKVVTALLRHERIESTSQKCDEARGYAERLIQMAIRNGDHHKETMEMADFWLLEKDLVHKLFKVLVPRYQNYTSSFTSMWTLPSKYPGDGRPMSVFELKGNPWPPVKPETRETRYLLTNALVGAAAKEFRENKQRQSLLDLENMTKTDSGGDETESSYANIVPSASENPVITNVKDSDLRDMDSVSTR